MYHRRKNEGQLTAAERQRLAVFDNQAVRCNARTEELLHHGKGLGIADDNSLRINRKEFLDAGGMIRLHMLNDQIIRLCAVERCRNIVQPLLREMCIRRIHNGGFFVLDDIGIISHAVRDVILSLEQVNLMIVDANVQDGIRYFVKTHLCFLPLHFLRTAQTSGAG